MKPGKRIKLICVALFVTAFAVMLSASREQVRAFSDSIERRVSSPALRSGC